MVLCPFRKVIHCISALWLQLACHQYSEALLHRGVTPLGSRRGFEHFDALVACFNGVERIRKQIPDDNFIPCLQTYGQNYDHLETFSVTLCLHVLNEPTSSAPGHVPHLEPASRPRHHLSSQAPQQNTQTIYLTTTTVSILTESRKRRLIIRNSQDAVR